MFLSSHRGSIKVNDGSYLLSMRLFFSLFSKGFQDNNTYKKKGSATLGSYSQKYHLGLHV